MTTQNTIETAFGNLFDVAGGLTAACRIAVTMLQDDDYESAKVRKYLTSPCKERDDIEITISDPSDDSIIESYKIHNASLIGESINSSYGKETSVELSYKGYVNKNRT